MDHVPSALHLDQVRCYPHLSLSLLIIPPLFSPIFLPFAYLFLQSATLIKNGNAASMIYIDQANPTATYSGVCNLVTPVAMCTLNVQETGAPLPPTGGSGAPGSTNTGRPGSGGNGGTGGAAGSGVTALLIGVSTAVLGFGVGVSLLS